VYLQMQFVMEIFRAVFFVDAPFRLSIEGELAQANPVGRARNP